MRLVFGHGKSRTETEALIGGRGVPFSYMRTDDRTWPGDSRMPTPSWLSHGNYKSTRTKKNKETKMG